jgi:microsomal dipeptidase-like Zn-dependent dipeptidase
MLFVRFGYFLVSNHYIKNFNGTLDIPVFIELFTGGMIQRGYNDDEISKVLGLNWLRVYKQVLG